MFFSEITDILQDNPGEVSVLLKDLQTNSWILRYNMERKVPSASLIKLLIAVEALRQVIDGIFSLEDKITIQSKDKVPFSILSDLNTDCYTFHDIIMLMITVSDNTAANVLIDLLSEKKINELAVRLNLNDTSLQRRMMDFDAVRKGKQNTTSPRDMATLLEQIYKRQILNESLCNILMEIMKRQKDKTMLMRYIPEETDAAHKTGELENLNHDIGIFHVLHHTYLLGVFVTDAKSNLTARQIIGRISDIVYRYYCNRL